jgi:hypothetical protein
MSERIPLDVIDVSTPCPVDWDEMRGTDRVRFCGQCKLHVYNLSAMSRHEAEELINETEGRLCVNFYRRTDGTIVTADCSRLRQAARVARHAWASAYAISAALVCALLAPLGFGASSQTCEKDPLNVEPNPVTRILGGVSAPAPEVRGEVMVTGKIAVQPPVTQPATAPATQPVN